MFERTINKNSINFLAILSLQLILSVYLSIKLNIWVDEAYTLHTTSIDLKYAFWQSILVELQAPLYFTVLKLWRYFNDSIIFARLFSVLSIFFAGVSCVGLSKRYFNALPPAYLVASVALNPFALWASSEIRLYAFVVLLVCLNLILYHDIFLGGSNSKIKIFLYILTALTGIYVHYYFGILILSNFTWILLQRDREVSKKIGIVAVILAVGIVPAFLMIKYQYPLITGGAPREEFFEQIRVIYGCLKAFFLPVEWMGSFSSKYFVIGILLIFIITLFKNKYLITQKHIAVWIQIAVMVLCSIILIHFTGKDYMQPRHLTVLFVPIILGAWAVLDTVQGKFRRYVLIIWILLFLLCYAITLVGKYRPMAKTGDFERVSEFIMQKERFGEPILVFPMDEILPFQQYYKGKNRLVPIPSEINFSNFDLKSFRLKDERQITEAINRESSGCRYLWIVTTNRSKFAGNDYNREVLEGFLSNHSVVNTAQEYFNVTIRRVELNKKYIETCITSTDH